MAILQELQRRKVIRAAAVYIVAAWLLLQIAATIAPIMNLPGWFERLVLALLILGFPIALILAWSLELTPDGIAADSSAQSSHSGRAVDYTLLTVIAAGLVWFATDRLRSGEVPIKPALDPSVAVLPFTNLNDDDANTAFTSGIHADLLTQLARIKSVRTVSRTTVLKYRDSGKTTPEIAAELGVATIVEGGVQRAGNIVRINVQLVDAAADQPLWTEAFERELTAANVFEIQSEIAKAIATQLRATLTAEEEQRLASVPTRSIDALDSYFVGRTLLEERNIDSLEAAIQYFETVVELDPEFALGWSGLADAYMLLPEYSSSADRELVEERAQAAVKRALEIDPGIPEVQATHAWYELRFYDWENAERIFREALTVAPDNVNVLHWLSHVLSFQGQFEEALMLARRAVAVDPETNMMRTNLSYILVDAGQFDEALQIAHRMRKANPDYMVQRRNLFLHELRAGRPAEAAETYVGYVRSLGADPVAAREIGEMFIAYGERGEVGNITEDLITRTQLGSEDLAQVLAFVGDGEGTILALQTALPEHSASRSVFSMKINPAYDFIRDDPRFAVLLEKAGLADDPLTIRN
jgi:TolB-like protein/cytochrome c-type biogenesis protein CcmH/NrfG